MTKNGQSLGYTGVDDATSLKTIDAAYDGGIRLFDTAAAYGIGHAERLLAKGLKGRSDALVITKIGHALNEDTREMAGEDTDPANIIPAIEACLRRLDRDQVDMVLLHVNQLPVAQAELLFDQMELAREAGKIRAYGWSTDFSAAVNAVQDRPGFSGVQYGMNVFLDAPRMRSVVAENGLVGMVRSPLAMGLLGGRYSDGRTLGPSDIRGTDNLTVKYFKDGRITPDFSEKLEAVRALLTTGGRSLVQGAMGWLRAKSDVSFPLPGMRTPEHVEGLLGALDHGPLPRDVMGEIDRLIPPPAEDAPDWAR